MTEPMLEPIFDNACYKVLAIFSVSPGSRFKRNEIKEKTKLNNVTLDKALIKLNNCNILGIENNYYRINFESENAKKVIEMVIKQYVGLKELPINVFLLIIDLTESLSTIRKIEVYLFGSYSKLIYREKSDVDIAVLLPSDNVKFDFDKLSQKLEKIYGKRVEIHDFDKVKFYDNKDDPLVSDILRNGVRLL